MLPKYVYSPHAPLLVDFTLTNHEGAAVAYHWRIAVSQPHPHVAKAGDVVVAPGSQASLAPVVNVTCSRRTLVTVSLSSGEHVDYWADCLAAQTPHQGRASPRSATPQGTGSRAAAHP
jgi:hypothetical protein